MNQNRKRKELFFFFGFFCLLIKFLLWLGFEIINHINIHSFLLDTCVPSQHYPFAQTQNPNPQNLCQMP